MKKITLLVAVLSAGLLLSACGNSKSTTSSSSSSSSSQTSSTSSSSSSSMSESSSSSSSATTSGINLTEILQNNFNSLDGTWKNANGQTIQFENGKLVSTIDVTVTVASDRAGVYLNVNPNGPGGYGISVYPANTKITGLGEANGQQDWTGANDPTDQTKDRLLSGQSAIAASDAAQQVYYRTSN